MGFLSIIPSYIAWHYTSAFRQMFHVLGNMLWFVAHLFSIGPLSRTLFAPWHRMTEEREAGFTVEDFLGTLVINFFSRILGALFRSAVILCGLLVLVTCTITVLLVCISWIFLPGLILLGFVHGLSLFFI